MFKSFLSSPNLRHSSSFNLIRTLSSVNNEVIVSFKNVNFSFPNKPILSNANFNVRQGSKITLMGQNGAGKSTLFKLMTSQLTPTSGTINVKKNLALSYPSQVISIEERELTVYEYFLKKAHGVKAGLDSQIAKVMKLVELDSVVKDQLIDYQTRHGISEEQAKKEFHFYNRKVKSFSGGQQARLLLATAFLNDADVILLDEPTNNLDVKGIELLKNIVMNTDKTCILISHDEKFLNSVSDSVIYLDSFRHAVEYYEGNYNDVKEEVAARIKRENAENARIEREIERKKEKANDFSNKGSSKAAKKLLSSVETLSEKKVDARRNDKVLKNFKIPYQTNDGRSAGVRHLVINSITLPNGSTISYESYPFHIEKGMKFRLKGPNGIGKTTFLEALVNREADGVQFSSNGLTIGYYRQDFSNLDHNKTILQILDEASNGKHSQEYIRKTAANFFFTKEEIKQKVSTLSEGQKGLVSLCSLVLTEPALLIMDEPTNHINFRHIPAIVNAIKEYEGSLIFVSHDEKFSSDIKVDNVIDLGIDSKNSK